MIDARETARQVLRIWGDRVKLLETPDSTEVRKARIAALVKTQYEPVYNKHSKRAINASDEAQIRAMLTRRLKEGFGNPVLAAGSSDCPRIATSFRAADDPPEALFWYLTVEKKLSRMPPSYRSLASWVYVEGRLIEACFAAGPTAAARRQLHSRLMRAVALAVAGSRFDRIEETVSEALARFVMAG